MAEYSVQGDKLKKMINLAKTKAVPFAFCPGSKESEHVFAMHKTKSSEVLGKSAKQQGKGSKVTFGEVFVAGSLMQLTCERELPGMAKKLKKWLKAEKLPLNVKVLDKDGNLLEEDVDDLDPEASSEVDSGDEAPPIDAKALAGRIKETQSRVLAAKGDRAEKLKQALQGAVAQLKAGKLEQAEKAIAKIEKALGQNGRSQEATPPPPPPPPDPRLLKLKNGARTAAQRIEELPDGAARKKLASAIQIVLSQIEAGAAEKAINGLKSVQQALAKAGASLSEPEGEQEQQPEETAEESGGDTPARAPAPGPAAELRGPEMDGCPRRPRAAHRRPAGERQGRHRQAAGRLDLRPREGGWRRFRDGAEGPSPA